MPIGGINPNAAAGAYASSQNITGSGQVLQGNTQVKGIGGSPDQKSVGDVSFADVLSNSIEQGIDTMKAGEQTAAQAVTGEADVTDVVQAVTSAELTLQTVVSVRDRMISAYQEIMRMQI